MEDSQQTLQESFPVQAFEHQQFRAGWMGIISSTVLQYVNSNISNCNSGLQIRLMLRVCGITPRDMALSFNWTHRFVANTSTYAH